MLLRKHNGCFTYAASEAICRQGGDYLLPVKANQPALLEAIESQTDFREVFDTYQTTETSGNSTPDL